MATKPDPTIEEVIELKRTLDRALNECPYNFTQATGLHVRDIEVLRVEDACGEIMESTAIADVRLPS